MKKFTLILLAACFVAATTMAQKGPQRVVNLPAAKTEQLKKFTSKQHHHQMRPNLQQQHGQLTAKDARLLSALSDRNGLPKMSWQKAHSPRKVGMITTQPDGNYMAFERNGDSYVSTLYGVYYNEVIGKLGELVFASDNKVYMKDIISQYVFDTWVEGTFNGTTITFTFPQMVTTVDGEDFYAMVMDFDADEMTYVPTAGDGTMTLNFDPKRRIVTTSDPDFVSGDKVIGLAYANGAWAGSADWNITMRPITDEPVSAPEGLETAQFIVAADGFSGTIANVGFDGNDVYVQGIYPSLPDTWVKGTIEGDKAIFKSGQFLGLDAENGYVEYLISATSETTHVEDPEWGDYDETYYYVSNEDIVFDYDAQTQTFTGTTLFMANAGKTKVYYGAIYENCIIKPFIEVAATPMAPYDLFIEEGGFDYYNEGWGWGYFEFVAHNNDEDGNYILPEKLSYQFWVRVNGEEKPLVLHNYDYKNMEATEMAEIPFGYNDGWDMAVTDAYAYLYYYVVGPEAYGVQAIYRGAGEERRSEIAWVEVENLGAEVQPDAATPAYPDVDPDDVGNTITYGSYTGNESRVTFGEWKPQTYDVAMKIDEGSVVGTHIDAVTFNMKTINGISNLKVWLSSQLRVENGENAPDLVCIDVPMPTKAGDVTATLPKPYIVPAEGVYVGYSFTVSEDAYSYANAPVTVIDEVKPCGFYIHSTASIVKWLELSEQSGYSTCMTITLSGKTVKANAVAPVDGEPVYVLKDEAIEVPLTFANQGSEGIKSIDFNYTFNGTTASKHIDLNSSVKGFLGMTYDYSLTLPAINEPGNYDLDVEVVKVNGVDNEADVTTAATTVTVMGWMPKHRTLLEEYTGLWCGWCPRGFVALELLKEQYPDEFVCVSYHNGDPMEITDFYPSLVEGFPCAWVDRGMEVDPYYGLGEDDFGVLDVLQWRNTMFGYANLEVTATLSDDNSTVDVNADVTFPYSSDNVNFSLEYMLVEDGLTSDDWLQANYYAGGDNGDMSTFDEAPEDVPGLVFNDVLVMQSEMGGIYESLPTEVTADVPVNHTYAFELDYALNMDWEPIIQDYSQLFVVALLIDNETGIVANAIKVPVGTATVGIENVKTQNVGAQRIYDLMGRRVLNPQKGLYIVNGRKVVK